MISRDREATLRARRREIYERIGPISDQVVSRVAPEGLWPASALGCIRIIRRPRSRLLITDGLSSPYDPELHADPAPTPLGYELAIDILDVDPICRDDETLSSSWIGDLLLTTCEWLVAQQVDLQGALAEFNALTLATPARTETAHEIADERGLVGLLVGLPFGGGNIGEGLYIEDAYRGLGTGDEDAPIVLLSVKPLTRDEYEWAVSRGDSGAIELAERFRARGDNHLSWTDRPSVLAVPEFQAASH